MRNKTRKQLADRKHLCSTTYYQIILISTKFKPAPYSVFQHLQPLL